MVRLFQFIALFAAASFLLAACQSDAIISNSTNAVQEPINNATINLKLKELEGTYTGDFGESGIIYLVLSAIEDGKASGYSKHLDLQRPFNGTVTTTESGYDFTLEEPGDNDLDGTFTFTIDPETKVAEGEWKPKNPESTAAKSYILNYTGKE